jgi:hypothetical protein
MGAVLSPRKDWGLGGVTGGVTPAQPAADRAWMRTEARPPLDSHEYGVYLYTHEQSRCHSGA